MEAYRADGAILSLLLAISFAILAPCAAHGQTKQSALALLFEAVEQHSQFPANEHGDTIAHHLSSDRDGCILFLMTREPLLDGSMGDVVDWIPVGDLDSTKVAASSKTSSRSSPGTASVLIPLRSDRANVIARTTTSYANGRSEMRRSETIRFTSIEFDDLPTAERFAAALRFLISQCPQRSRRG